MAITQYANKYKKNIQTASTDVYLAAIAFFLNNYVMSFLVNCCSSSIFRSMVDSNCFD